MSDVEWELWCHQQRAKLEEDIRAEAPAFDVEQMLAWVDGHSADDAVEAARERLDIEPLVWKRAAEIAQRARSLASGTSLDVSTSVYELRKAAIQSLHRELREVCLVAISSDETRKRFLAAWDAQWPEGM